MSRFQSDIQNAVRDVVKAADHWPVSVALGWNDVKNRYNRSRLGVFWASLSMLIFVGALGPIYARLIGVEVREYMIHLLLGFIVWSYISSLIMESGREFINSISYLTSFQLSYFSLLLRVVWRNLVVFGYQMLVFVFFALLLKQQISMTWLLAPIALLLITLNALWMGLLMSIFATRFRDFSELMNNILRLVFFITPIIWMPRLSPELLLVAELNPFYHLLEIFRKPLLHAQVDNINWLIAVIMAVVGWLVAFPIFARYRSRIAFWL